MRPPPLVTALCELPKLHGDGAVWAEAAAPARVDAGSAGARRAARPLGRAAASGLESVLRVDLGEVRGFAYYTGAIFHLLAEGPGEPIGSGGRYDDLLARFGAPMPAAGFALDLDNLAWALRIHGREEELEPRLVWWRWGLGPAPVCAALAGRAAWGAPPPADRRSRGLSRAHGASPTFFELPPGEQVGPLGRPPRPGSTRGREQDRTPRLQHGSRKSSDRDSSTSALPRVTPVSQEERCDADGRDRGGAVG